jgi:hypothetical protein
MDISVHVDITTGKERIKKSKTDHNIFYPKEFLISHIKWREVKIHWSYIGFWLGSVWGKLRMYTEQSLHLYET